MSGTLHIVATPIGNIQDISLRALDLLLHAEVIACEDTRKTGILLKKLEEILPILPISNITNKDHKPRLISYYDQVEQQKIPELLQLLIQGTNVVLVSDAGTPLVSDPGYKLVRTCIESGIRVESVPGPSSVVTALTVSGLPTDKFFFVGYLPKKSGHRKKLLEDTRDLVIKTTIIFFEAPHRLQGTLEELAVVFGKEKQIVIARELTKTYEEVLRDSVGNLQEHFASNSPKGEFVLVFTTA